MAITATSRAFPGSFPRLSLPGIPDLLYLWVATSRSRSSGAKKLSFWEQIRREKCPFVEFPSGTERSQVGNKEHFGHRDQPQSGLPFPPDSKYSGTPHPSPPILPERSWRGEQLRGLRAILAPRLGRLQPGKFLPSLNPSGTSHLPWHGIPEPWNSLSTLLVSGTIFSTSEGAPGLSPPLQHKDDASAQQ